MKTYLSRTLWSSHTPALAAFVILTLLFATGAHALTPADQQELKNFTLTKDFLHRFTSVAKEAHDSHTDISVSEKIRTKLPRS